MGQSKERLKIIVRNVIDYWKDEFRRAYRRPDLPEIAVGAQTFVETDCADLGSTAGKDLVFQFGVLTDEQARWIGQPRNFIGLAVRTEYDLINLAGKGFIYIAPQSGSLKPQVPNFRNAVWEECDGCQLAKVVAHELGHVFGLRHKGQSYDDIMSEGFSQAPPLARIELAPVITASHESTSQFGLQDTVVRTTGEVTSITIGGINLIANYFSSLSALYTDRPGSKTTTGICRNFRRARPTNFSLQRRSVSKKGDPLRL